MLFMNVVFELVLHLLCKPGFHLGFFVWGGGKIVCKDQLCVKHAKFLSPFLSINHQCTKKHKVRVFIILIVKTFFLGGGGGEVGGFRGEVGGFGGEASPPPHTHTPQ